MLYSTTPRLFGFSYLRHYELYSFWKNPRGTTSW